MIATSLRVQLKSCWVWEDQYRDQKPQHRSHQLLVMDFPIRLSVKHSGGDTDEDYMMTYEVVAQHEASIDGWQCLGR